MKVEAICWLTKDDQKETKEGGESRKKTSQKAFMIRKQKAVEGTAAMALFRERTCKGRGTGGYDTVENEQFVIWLKIKLGFVEDGWMDGGWMDEIKKIAHPVWHVRLDSIPIQSILSHSVPWPNE